MPSSQAVMGSKYSLSHHEASSRLGLRHSPTCLAWARVVAVSQVLHVLGKLRYDHADDCVQEPPPTATSSSNF